MTVTVRHAARQIVSLKMGNTDDPDLVDKLNKLLPDQIRCVRQIVTVL